MLPAERENRADRSSLRRASAARRGAGGGPRRRHRAVKVRGRGVFYGIEIGGVAVAEAETRADLMIYACLRAGLGFKVGGGRS